MGKYFFHFEFFALVPFLIAWRNPYKHSSKVICAERKIIFFGGRLYIYVPSHMNEILLNVALSYKVRSFDSGGGAGKFFGTDDLLSA